jgi:hypothetical protein
MGNDRQGHPTTDPEPVYAMTLDEVAEAIGLSRERTRQIEKKALRKLRRWCQASGYRPEDLLDLAARARIAQDPSPINRKKQSANNPGKGWNAPSKNR